MSRASTNAATKPPSFIDDVKYQEGLLNQRNQSNDVFARPARTIMTPSQLVTGRGKFLYASHGHQLVFPPHDQSVAMIDGGVEYQESPPDFNTQYHRLNNVTPNSSGSGNMLKYLKRQALGLLEVVTNGVGVVRMAALGRLQEGTLESEEARFRSHLDAVSDISRSSIERALSEQYDTNAALGYDPLELQSFIDSMRTALHEDTAIILPYSRLLGAEQRQRQLDEATGMFQNWINEFTLNSLMAHSSHGSMLENKMKALEEKMRELDQRIRVLEDKFRVLNI